MRGSTGSLYRLEDYWPAGEIIEYRITKTDWSMNYLLDGVEYYEEASSTDGVTYKGVWSKPGERNPVNTVNFHKWMDENGEILMLVEWMEGDVDGGQCMYRLSLDKEER